MFICQAKYAIHLGNSESDIEDAALAIAAAGHHTEAFPFVAIDKINIT